MKKLLTLLFMTGFLASFAMAEEVKPTANYTVLKEVPARHSQDKVVMEEFINFGCPHCNSFLNSFAETRKKYLGRVTYVAIPILFQGQNDASIRLFYVAKKLGKQDQILDELFKAKFTHGVDVFDPGIVNYLARSLGMADEYRKESNSEWVTNAIKAGEEKAKAYKVDSTPTIVIAESMVMHPAKSMDLFIQNITTTLDDILKEKK